MWSTSNRDYAAGGIRSRFPTSSAALPARAPPVRSTFADNDRRLLQCLPSLDGRRLIPQRPGPCLAGTLPTTTPTVDRGWLRRHRPRAVAVVASWRRPGVPEPPSSSPLRQPTAPAAALLLGPKADRPRRTHDWSVPVCRTVRPLWPIAPGSGRARFPQFRNAGSGHWLTPCSLFLPKSDDILTNPSG